MVTMAQRIEELRTERGLSRPALAAELGMPKGAFEKFETGRQTPSRDQQQKLADYFGVSLLYLRGESGDRTRQEDWMNAAMDGPEEVGHVPFRPAPKKEKVQPVPQGTVLDAMLSSRQVQDSMREVILETLRSPEGQKILEQVVRKVTGTV